MASRRRLKRSRPFVAIALLAALTWAPSAQAQSAEELKERGNQAMVSLNYAEALASYQAALEKNPNDVVLHYNIGRAHQARGDYPAALDALVAFDEKAPPETKAKVPSLPQLIADVRSHVGELSIRCSAEAQGTVLVGELARVVGCGPNPRRVRVSVPAKTATIEVRLQSDTSVAPSRTVTLEGGGPPAEVALEVSPRMRTGVLRVVASPATAVVSVDGQPKGNPPLEVILPPGSHVVDVTASGHESAHVPFVLESAGRKELTLQLEKTPPITKRWWFWAGAAGVAAGIATAAVILIVQPERESSRGTIDPGVVRAPLATF